MKSKSHERRPNFTLPKTVTAAEAVSFHCWLTGFHHARETATWQKVGLMKLWMSGEIQADIADAYRQARKTVETGVNRLLAEVSLAEKVKEWAFIAIIREGR